MTFSCGTARYSTEPGHAALVAPAKIAEGDTGKPALSERRQRDSQMSASQTSSEAIAGEGRVPSDAAGESPPELGFAPDPQPLETRHHYEFEFEYERGEIRVVGVRPLTTDKPTATARMMGRFAVELWLGPELIDRVRFDFPLLGAEAPAGDVVPLHSSPRFAGGAVVRRAVIVPHTDRATSARLIDRATGHELELEWPPRAPALDVESAATSEQ